MPLSLLLLVLAPLSTLATSSIHLDAQGAVSRSFSDQRAPRKDGTLPPASATVVPLYVAVNGKDGRANRTAIVAAVAAAARNGTSATTTATSEAAPRGAASMTCPKRTCAAFEVNVTFTDATAARRFRVGVDAGGARLAAVARAALAAADGPAKAATVQYAHALFPDDLPDDFDYYVALPDGRRVLGAGAVVAIVSAVALVAVSAVGMAGTLFRRRGKEEAEEAREAAEGRGDEEEGRGVKGGVAAAAAVAESRATAPAATAATVDARARAGTV